MILRRQLPAWSPLTLQALLAGLGPPTDALTRIERRILAEHDARAAILVRSGTVALALAFLASVPDGTVPRIGLPSWGCYDLMTAADAAGAEVWLYDLDPATLAPEAGSFARAIASGLHAVVVAHWFGVPVDLRPLLHATSLSGTVLIDDAAQAAGASLLGVPLGSGGDFGILSFGRGKGRTGGAGGVLLAMTSRAQAGIERISRHLGRSPGDWGPYLSLWFQWALGRPGLYGIPSMLPGLRLGETIYRPPPELRRMSARSAAVVDRVWDLAATESETRRATVARWQAVLDRCAHLTPVTPPRGSVPGWLRLPLVADEPLRARLTSPFARRHGILRGYPLPLDRLPVAPGRMALSSAQFPGARFLSERLFTLPTHSRVSEFDLRMAAKLFDLS